MASGNPTPTYAPVGALPSGIAFNTTTRVLSGAHTGTGSGTIRIRASSSQGSDDWTVAYSTSAALAAPAFADGTGDAQNWIVGAAIGAITVPSATGNPAPTYVATGRPAGINFNTTTRVISGSPTAAGSGTITVTATNSQGSDTWTVAYTVVLASAAPVFADDTGDAQNWTQNTTIAPITVPTATGTPAPTYAATGVPAGINFNATTRAISGTPTAAGSGTITITATNSEGSDDWTVAYSTAADTVAPAFADDTGNTQAWTVGTAITPVTVPAATGNPTPTYAPVGALPGGIAFNATTRVISGTRTTTGSGTIRIRAANSAGSDDWTVSYTTAAAPVLLVLADWDDTDLQVETAALLEANGPGTSSNNFYLDVSRGGSGTPIEGELGVGTGETVIDRLRRASTANLTINDSNSPVALDFNTFFGTGGDGRDLTVYLQTAIRWIGEFHSCGYLPQCGGQLAQPNFASRSPYSAQQPGDGR